MALRGEALAACTPQGRPTAWHWRAEQRFVGAIEAIGFAKMLKEWNEIVIPKREWREAKRLHFGKVEIEENVGDMLTRAMTQKRLIKLSRMSGLRGGPYDLSEKREDPRPRQPEDLSGGYDKSMNGVDMVNA